MRALIIALAALCATPATAQISNPSGAAVDQAARDAAAAAQAAAAAKATPADLAAVQAAIPLPATGMPPSVADAGARGTSMRYALENHTHASKARKDRVLVPVAGFLDVTFSSPFTTGAPLCAVTAETTRGDTNVVNAQIDGVTTMTGFRIRVTRTAITVASLLGLSILSVPTQVATYAHYICVEP